MSEALPQGGGEEDAVRFEDLTVDDDLPILDRIVRYTRSQIALQRLVHVKMLAETAELVGPDATREVLIPMVKPLVSDPESVIRQHLAAQLLPMSIVCMVQLKPNQTVQEIMDHPDNNNNNSNDDSGVQSSNKQYYAAGYQTVTRTVIVSYLNSLVSDIDVDVRRAAADALSGLALQIQPADVPTFCLPIPLRLAHQKSSTAAGADPAQQQQTNSKGKAKKSDADQLAEELRITAANLLAELGGAASEHSSVQQQQQKQQQNSNTRGSWVSGQILPAVLQLCNDSSFRVRRSSAQALPRILGACTAQEAAENILPAFDMLSRDDLYRVRKSTGECLVDMSRSLMILATSVSSEKDRASLYELRRRYLIPIADRLIQDQHKMVRQGMMQFLGPFMASFYPYQKSVLHGLLPASTESDGSNHMGIVAQFFPHATSMVSRLNSAQNAISAAPTPVNAHVQEIMNRTLSEQDKLQRAMPTFLQASRMSALSLAAVQQHRKQHPPATADVQAIVDNLLDYFAALAIVSTGDENTDAEMRVYCAYSFPAIVLLLGPENWEGAMKTCFFTLLNPQFSKNAAAGGGGVAAALDGGGGSNPNDPAAVEPPLPVKRCLASSLHTVAHILGPEIAAADILPVVQGFFLNDSDESVRLNVIRNFPSMLQLLSNAHHRKEPFLLWSEVVRGPEFLGANSKRSATNPLVLNWRQRDYLARSLPSMILLLEPVLVHDHIWPILQLLLTDPISNVKEDAIWALPILVKAYCPESMEEKWNVSGTQSQAWCTEVVEWLKDSIVKLGISPDSRGCKMSANFSDRQLYCRICGAFGLALQFAEQYERQQRKQQQQEDDVNKDPVSVLGEKFHKIFLAGADHEKEKAAYEEGPYQRLQPYEKKHLTVILTNDILPIALPMNEDRISNVRVTLMKVLQLMPEEIRTSPSVQPVLKGLEDEVQTWESFGEESGDLAKPFVAPSAADLGRNAPTTLPAKQQQQQQNNTKEYRGDAFRQQERETGPIDVDEVIVTPTSSRDEGDQDYGAMSDPSDHRGGDQADSGPDRNAGPDHNVNRHRRDSSSADEDNKNNNNSSGKEKTRTPAAVAATDIVPMQKDWRTVIFDSGPIGLQLEPTGDDKACRVYGFLDQSDTKPSPARVSGKIQMGDVIVMVNGVYVNSYDETISILKAGGKREITFRPGTEDDDYDAYLSSSSDGGRSVSDEESRRQSQRRLEEEKKLKAEAAAAAAASVPTSAAAVKKVKKVKKEKKEDKKEEKKEEKKEAKKEKKEVKKKSKKEVHKKKSKEDDGS